MQNEAIEDMIVLFVTNNSSRSKREYYLSDQGLRPDDPGYNLDGLPLGRIGNYNFVNGRMLDRMLMYKRQDIDQEQAIAKTETLMEKKSISVGSNGCNTFRKRVLRQGIGPWQ